MPSGSRGGSRSGGGSHFGGGSRRSGGSHFGGGSRRSDHHDRHGHGRSRGGYSFGMSFVFVNRGHYAGHWGGAMNTLMIFGLIFCFFIALPMFVIGGSNRRNVAAIKSDYKYYQNMIKVAEKTPGYIIEGTIISTYGNENSDKWYVTYYFKTESGNRVEGYTFSIYTFEQASQFMPDDKILLAVDRLPLSSETDSINVDYKNTKLSDDGEYQAFSKRSKIFNIIGAVSICIGIAMFAISIVLRAKAPKQELAEEPKAGSLPPLPTSSTTQSSQPQSQTQTASMVTCAYCGSHIKSDKSSCPKCGASNFKN